MKKTFFTIISAITIYYGNISDVYAADLKDLFRKEWSKYVYLRNEINVMNLPDREKIERVESHLLESYLLSLLMN